MSQFEVIGLIKVNESLIGRLSVEETNFIVLEVYDSPLNVFTVKHIYNLDSAGLILIDS